MAERAEMVLTGHIRMLVTSASSHTLFESLGRVEEKQLGQMGDH